MYFRSFFTVLFLVLSSPTLACDPNNVLCSKLINPVILQLKDLNQFFVWVILGLLSLSILYLAYTFFIDIVNFASKYKKPQIGEYVQLPDGTFVLAGSKQHQWLEYDGGTVHFSNEAFDKAHKTPFDWNDPALDYLGKEQPEIIGYNDKYFDDVYSGGHSANLVDDGFDEEMNVKFGGFFDFSVNRETGEVIDDPYDDWRG
jgi:hypothetical protein